jgi:hypothetical protein
MRRILQAIGICNGTHSKEAVEEWQDSMVPNWLSTFVQSWTSCHRSRATRSRFHVRSGTFSRAAHRGCERTLAISVPRFSIAWCCVNHDCCHRSRFLQQARATACVYHRVGRCCCYVNLRGALHVLREQRTPSAEGACRRHRDSDGTHRATLRSEVGLAGVTVSEISTRFHNSRFHS